MGSFKGQRKPLSTSWSRICTVNFKEMISNYQLSPPKIGAQGLNCRAKGLEPSVFIHYNTEPLWIHVEYLSMITLL